MLRRRPATFHVIPLTAVLAAGACGVYKAREAPARLSGGSGLPAGPAPEAQDQARSLGATATALSTAGQPPATARPGADTLLSRKLIRTAQVSLEVGQLDEAAAALARLAAAHGGYLADAQVSRAGEGRRRGVFTLRVAAEGFEAALSGLRGLGEVETENIAAQDVTKAYFDLENRLRVKRETADRLREILKTRTTNLADILQAEQALARLAEEIEQLEGERRYFDQQVALSTITVTAHEPQALVRPGMAEPILEALRGSGHVLASSAAALVYAAAFLGPWSVVLFILWRVVRAVRRGRMAIAG
ncbi:MAG TPA: DUF4349 domain-containing protein [Vicinamibacteria bacterium]|nr:DUF4349 domain-containing protein [Vicinamibacteria bacterium]